MIGFDNEQKLKKNEFYKNLIKKEIKFRYKDILTEKG